MKKCNRCSNKINPDEFMISFRNPDEKDKRVYVFEVCKECYKEIFDSFGKEMTMGVYIEKVQ